MASVGKMEGIPFFYHFICHTCKEESTVLKNCKGCHLVSYCSVDHQKVDWTNHKDLCRCIQELLKKWNVPNIFGIESKTVDEWRHVRLSLIYCVQEHLSRPLAIDEKQMFYFAKVCRVCFSTNVSTDYKCDQCCTVVYCSEEHRDNHIEKHLLECSELRNCYIIDKLCAELNAKPKKIENYFQFSLSDKTLPDDIMTFIKDYFQFDGIDSLLFSESLSGSLSLVYSILSCLQLPLISKESLKIHVIGASIYERSFIKNIEVLFHCISALNELSIFLIGPEYACSINTEVNLCDICSEKKLSIKGSTLLYHKFVLSQEFEKPDIIVAFNCGYNEFSKTNKDTWKASLSHVLELKDILFMFTSYTKDESIEDYRIVKELSHNNQDNIYFNKVCYENPFRSHRPHRDWEVNDKEIFYLNNYISIIEISG